MSGIEFLSTANGSAKVMPADGTVFAADYLYNAVPAEVEAAARVWGLMTTDVRVHQAKIVLLNIYMAVIFTSGYTPSSVISEIEVALNSYIGAVGFNGVVQVSDLVAEAHRVPGVDAVRLLTNSDDGTHYAIQAVSTTGTILTTYATNVGGQIRRATDVILSDDQVPVLNTLTVVAKAQNSFGAV